MPCATRSNALFEPCGRLLLPMSFAVSSVATAMKRVLRVIRRWEHRRRRLHIDTWRWAGVPFYIRAGKRMPVTATEVLVELKHPPQAVFDTITQSQANYFRFGLSPNVSIALGARAKMPGEPMVGEHVELLVRPS